MKWHFSGSYRMEWICEHGVGHYDPNLVEFTVHGCDGCCSRNDFPPYAKGKDYYKSVKNCGIKLENKNE